MATSFAGTEPTSRDVGIWVDIGGKADIVGSLSLTRSRHLLRDDPGPLCLTMRSPLVIEKPIHLL